MLVSLTGLAQLKQRGINNLMPLGQVHLDFYNSKFIPGIGEKFDKKKVSGSPKNGTH